MARLMRDTLGLVMLDIGIDPAQARHREPGRIHLHEVLAPLVERELRNKFHSVECHARRTGDRNVLRANHAHANEALPR